MDPAIIEKTYSAVVVQLRHIPFLLLQAVAIVGCVAILLLYRNRVRLFSRDSLAIGIIMGLTCFLMMTILHEQMRSILKLVAALDFIFIAGVLGGWRNALVTLVMVFVARALIGGALYLDVAVLDFTFFAVSGVAAHAYLFTNEDGVPSLKSILLLLWRFVTGEASFLLVWLLDMVSTDLFTDVMIRRALGSWTVSVCVIMPIVLLVRQAAVMERLVFCDPVTGLPNRREMEHRLHKVLRSKQKRQVRRTLLLIRLENFSLMTQNYGHRWMDRFCAAMGQYLRKHCREELGAYSSALFSFSENAYALVLRHSTREDVQETGLAHRLHSALHLAAKQPQGALQPVFGISVMDIDFTPNFDEVRFLRSLSLLDEYSSGAVLFFEPTLTKQIAQNEYILSKLMHWEAHGGVPVWFQPKVLLAEGICYGAEALLRVPEASGEGYINPHGLLITAEKCGLRQGLEWGIVCSVVERLAMLPPDLAHMQVSVNLTPDVFSEPDFGIRMLDLLAAKGVAPQRLVVEVIETSKFKGTDVVQANMAALAEAGVKLSLDDFGTAYASISLLSRYHFRELKLDYSMISNIDNPRMREAILLSIEGARRYDSSIVAEGIETEEQRRMLLEMGVRHGQGFLFGRAMPYEAFVAFAQEHR